MLSKLEKQSYLKVKKKKPKKPKKKKRIKNHHHQKSVYCLVSLIVELYKKDM